MAKPKKRKPKPDEPDATVAWTVDGWLGLAGHVARLRQHHLAERSAHADWLQGLIQHLARAVNKQTGGITAGKEDQKVQVIFRRETFNWCRNNLIIPDERKPEDPAIKETADRVRQQLASGELEI